MVCYINIALSLKELTKVIKLVINAIFKRVNRNRQTLHTGNQIKPTPNALQTYNKEKYNKQ